MNAAWRSGDQSAKLRSAVVERQDDMNAQVSPNSRSSFRLVGVMAFVGLVLTGCASGRLDTTKPVGQNAKDIDFLYRLSGIMAAVVGILVGAAVIVIIVKFRAKKDTYDELPEQIHGHLKAELTWTAIPALMLAGLAAFTLPVIFQLNEEGDGSTIQVEGQQWWWQFTYDLDNDGVFETQTANEIVIRVGEEVNLEITSNDVIHSFWVPELNGKRDAVPGRVHPWRISSPVEGIFWGECTEFCGLSHANMQIRAVVLNDAEYVEWVAGQLTDPAVPPADTAAAAGAEVFAAQCARCHVVNGSYETAAGGKAGVTSGYAPNLSDLMSRTSFAGALFELYDKDGNRNLADLREWVRDAPGMKPMAPDNLQGMPSFAETLSETELDNILAYLQTLGEDPPLMPS
jgi:cytochrome c oxidase subunit II